MKIRDFTLEDQSNVKALALKCWLFTYKDIYSDKKIRETVNEWYSEKVHKEIIDSMKKGEAVVKILELNKQIIGLISTYQSKEGLEMKRLYIDPEYIGQGFGSQLLEEVEEILRQKGVKEYFCFVHRKNEIGQNFYKKKGFLRDESRSNKEDFYMAKSLVSNIT